MGMVVTSLIASTVLVLMTMFVVVIMAGMVAMIMVALARGGACDFSPWPDAHFGEQREQRILSRPVAVELYPDNAGGGGVRLHHTVGPSQQIADSPRAPGVADALNLP